MNSDELIIDNLPNRITLFRICLIPVIIGSLLVISFNLSFTRPYQFHLEWVACLSFAMAAITDFIDGYVARKRQNVTIFGSFLDPIADKFLTISSLIMLLALGRVGPLIVLILVMREIYITSLRLLASTEGLSVPVNSLGKWKTAAQMIGIPLLMNSGHLGPISFYISGKIFIYVASFLSVYSSVIYSMGLIRKIKARRLEKKINKTV